MYTIHPEFMLLSNPRDSAVLQNTTSRSSFPLAESNNTVAFTHFFSFPPQVQAILSEANDKFTKAYERMIGEGLPESLTRCDKAYAEARTQISTFLRREKGAEKALECVTITALCALNKK